jgi:putative glycosyltransferase (TIGR04348 family)
MLSRDYAVSVVERWDGSTEAPDAMLALHARRSASSISHYHRQRQRGGLLLALTGTDVYRDIRISGEAQESLERADRLIVLQSKAIEELAPHLRGKARVVVQSSATALRHHASKGPFRLCVIGHLREEKDPLRTLAALRFLPDAEIEVVQIGALLDPALRPETQDKRYRWLGGVPHGRALKLLASSHAMIISSLMEGGANVVCEAIRIGVPILASHMSGNIGLLGENYAGYFPVGDARALARLIAVVAKDKKLYSTMKKQLAKLRPMVAPSAEARALIAAIRA